jgi:general secretion pathway protein A
MYTAFYGLKEKPFNLVADPGCFFMSAKHKTALTYLEYGLADGIGFILLTGEVGAGKTTIIKRFLKQVDSDVEVAVIFNTNVTAEQLLELILEELELRVPKRGKGACLDVLNQFLIAQYGLGRRVVLIVDEAQNLSQEALEEIRMLSNLQTEKASLLQIILVGQPGLRTRLQHPALTQLSQRIAVSYHLAPFNLEETTDYVCHRLKAAGSVNGDLFEPEAVAQVFQYSGGIPRAINILCDAALVYGFADELTKIDGHVIEQVVKDRQETGLPTTYQSGGNVQWQGENGADYSLNGRLLKRIEDLEQRMGQLADLVDGQITQQDAHVESYKDALIQRLENMVAQERKRADKLLVYYNVLRDRLKSRRKKKSKE